MTKSSRPRVLVGTCGFGEAQTRVFRDCDILEVQQSFYQPPRVETAERWRRRAPQGFMFTLKAWQLLTHEASSPTYRGLKVELSEAECAQAGGFKWNGLTRMAWERTRAVAAAVEAEAVVFQTPRRFQPTRESLRRLRRFFERIERDGRRMVFEPRGDRWSDDVVRGLAQDLDLVHGVDPFLRRPVGRGLRYFRLHGRPAYRYRYRYSDADLALLEGALSRAWPNWVLFNNDAMNADARRFRERLVRG